ncbi:hypothetical protein Amn_21000 [Aminobacter sp. Y103A]|nr:hypothetical protein Amn_21000 [Aminobacter sp. SS-2016]
MLTYPFLFLRPASGRRFVQFACETARRHHNPTPAYHLACGSELTQSKRTKTRKRTIFEKADDPDRRDQAIGYDDLAAETGVRLEPAGRKLERPATRF